MSEVKLYLGDCLEIMRGMDADVCVTDPPYGIGETNTRNLSRANCTASIDYGEFEWDSKPASQEQIDACRNVSKNQVIFGGNYFVLPPSQGWIVWDKMNSGDFADCELAWTSYDRAIRKFVYMWNGMIKQKPERRYHPTQKPLELMEWVILNYTKPGDTVIDPFMGSGTTGVACVLTGRNFIGIDNEPRYVEIARKRIAQAQMQPNLFEQA